MHAMEAPDADMRETVPASEDEGLQRSPSPKRKLNPAEEAAAQDLVVRDPEGPPAWVESFQLAISAQVSTLGSHLKSFEQRLDMESKSRKEDISDVHRRLDDLTGKLEALSKGSGGTAGFRAVPPPDPWMQYRERRGSSNPRDHCGRKTHPRDRPPRTLVRVPMVLITTISFWEVGWRIRRDGRLSAQWLTRLLNGILRLKGQWRRP